MSSNHFMLKGNPRKIRDLLYGREKVEVAECLIDCDTQPLIPHGWRIKEHRQGGQLKIDLHKTSLYLSKKQENGIISGKDLYEELAGKQVLNANVLDYSLAHTERIPEKWKGKYIFFWGTIYYDADDCLCVRYLRWIYLQWRWHYFQLDCSFVAGCPAILV